MRPRVASAPAVPVVMVPTLIVALTVTVDPPERVTVLAPVVVNVCGVQPMKLTEPTAVQAPITGAGGVGGGATSGKTGTIGSGHSIHGIMEPVTTAVPASTLTNT